MVLLTLYFNVYPPPRNLSSSLKSAISAQSLNSPHAKRPPTFRTHIRIQRWDNSSRIHMLNKYRFLHPNLSILFLGLSFPLPSVAYETMASEEVSNKINLESVLISIDNFFTMYPFFVPTLLFIWLVAIPLSEEYLGKYKFVSAIDAFRKLRDDPSSQLLDIRDRKSLAYLGSPNLRILNKSVLQVEFREGREVDFVKKVLKSFEENGNATVCVIDNFDGNSIKVAELLVNNGFKDAYAIRGGIRGKKGWQEIQETLLPPSVHIIPKSKSESSKSQRSEGRQGTSNGDVNSSSNNDNGVIDTKEFTPNSSTVGSKVPPRTSSPYPNYPDFKPPSPSPSKPN